MFKLCLATSNIREVAHPNYDHDISIVSVDKVAESGAECPAADDGRPGLCCDDILGSGDR